MTNAITREQLATILRINAQISVTDRATAQQVNTLQDMGIDITPWLMGDPVMGEVDAVQFSTALNAWARNESD